MFKWLFYYWYNPTDTPYIVSKINLWSYINIRLFKIKLSNMITYFILGLNNLKIKRLKIFYKNLSYEIIYERLIYLIFLLLLLFLIFFFL